MGAEKGLIAITYGYSRDHRENLKQWRLANTHNGDVPLFLQPLDGKSSDNISLIAAVKAIQRQLREANTEPSVYVADNGIYSEPQMRQLNAAGVKWVSRVSETSSVNRPERIIALPFDYGPLFAGLALGSIISFSFFENGPLQLTIPTRGKCARLR